MIFISYRRYDWPFAHRLHEHLQTRLGGEVYIDRKITSDNYETELLAKVQHCSIFILIVTPNTFCADRIAQHEDWIRREVSLALSLGKPIVLVLYEGLSPPPPESLPEDIRQVTRRQGVAFYPAFFEQAVEQLVFHCAGLLPPNTIQQIAPPSVRPHPTRERRLEAAMPAETAQSAATEVRVKVSLPDSKGLRGELPARLKSGDEIKKADTRQTTFPMTFPLDETGRLLPATLCLEVTSQHFDVDFATYPESPCGSQRAEIELLPDLDSRTVIFTLIPRLETPYFGTSRVMVRVFYRGQLIAELRLATTIVPRVVEVQYILDASPLLVGARPAGHGPAPVAVTTAEPTGSTPMAQPSPPGGFSPPPPIPYGSSPAPPAQPRPRSTPTYDAPAYEPGQSPSFPTAPQGRPGAPWDPADLSRPHAPPEAPAGHRQRSSRLGWVSATILLFVAVVGGIGIGLFRQQAASPPAAAPTASLTTLPSPSPLTAGPALLFPTPTPPLYADCWSKMNAEP